MDLEDFLNQSQDMRFEWLMCKAYQCNTYGDPDGVAHQSYYNVLFCPDLNLEGTNILKKMINELIKRSTGNLMSSLIVVRESITETMKQEDGLELLNYVGKLIIEEESFN